MNYLSNSDINNKRVLLRCDFNVPVDNNIVVDNTKILKSLDTIKLLLNNNNKVIILSHFGRVKKEEDKEKNSLYPVYEELKKHIDIEFIDNPLNLDIINNSNSNCFLVENTRFTDVPKKRESENDLELAKYWSLFADVFVIDAFASLHRAHSSTAGISNYLDTYLGLLVQYELDNLNKLVNNPSKPFLVIMGGAKVDDKIQIIEGLINKCDKLLLTGGILNTFLKVSGCNVGKSLVSEDEEVLKSVKNILSKDKKKIIFTNTFIVENNGVIEEKNINNINDEDIIYDNIINNKNIFDNVKTIFFNGTCGMYENDNYKKGTISLLKNLDECDADVFIGGGDTASSVNNLGFEGKYTYVSSGGGATLEYVAYGELKALKYIENNSMK